MPERLQNRRNPHDDHRRVDHLFRLRGKHSGLPQNDHRINEGTGQGENVLQAEQKGRSQRRALVEAVNQISGLLCHDSKPLVA
jgi:hypothetical protein